MSWLQTATQANGAYAIIACAAVALLLAARPDRLPLRFPVEVISSIAFFLYGGLAAAYALYPNYSDIAGPAMTAVGIALLEGRPLYPGLDDYSFHGMLYGPLLAEIQAAGIYLGSGLAGLPVMVSSKLPGVLAFFAAAGVFLKAARGPGFATVYATLFLLPFQIVAFWNRCEPLLLLLVALSFWSLELPRARALLALGLCAGLASALKLHAWLYIAPAVAVFLSRKDIGANAVLRIPAAAAGAFLLTFAPDGVSLPAFLGYLRYAAGHGLSWQMFAVNLAFICALWSPLLVALAPGGRWRALLAPPLIALLAAELAVAIVGAKPGAGIHHLLPFIPANALIFARCLEGLPGPRARYASPAAVIVWLALLGPGLLACGAQARSMAWNWPIFAKAGTELRAIQDRFPDVVMGAGGDATYPYVFLRPQLGWKGAAQVEYSSYMDLQLIGVPDLPLRRAFDTCEIGHLALPLGEAPFSLTTLYRPGMPLFSEELRATFRRRFTRVAYGAWFEVYACTPP